MDDLGADAAPKRFEVRVTANSHFAWLRTRMSLDSTLMAWIRTGTAFIGFGFTIVQFFERFSGMEGVAAPINPMAPKYAGLALVVAGIFSLTIAIFEYRRGLRYLWSEPYRALAGTSLDEKGDGETWTPALALALLLAIAGVFAFVAIVFRAI